MQFPTLETLRLTSCQLDPHLMMELSALQMPPLLTKIHLSSVRLSSRVQDQLNAQPPTAPRGHAPAFTTFVSDQKSLAFARLLYSSRPYPFGNLRELGITRDRADPSTSKAQQLLRKNPRLACLSTSCGDSPPRYDLSINVALRTLSIHLFVVEAWTPIGVVALLESIPASGERTLEHFRLKSANDGARTVEALEGWQAMDTALCRFEALQTVEMHFGMVWASAGEKLAELPGFMEKVHERGILNITYTPHQK
ncbi:uncharacterized protein SCHCODRAFT_02751843 [Schizophyllum commune H4-8]|uniref:uncharacterized protein n=1 Tax=Schizophyllum commune (strain H4-8 / FGSC 9210) TaxID=578458 RepID=UPI002160E2BF|nr:uncharacterized protein SCHCODRAFT_02751843 [Schizophyllum commune H4-8]KAI5888807.1 hypothetical protein SCHCODRAFT_02751843 [Schizophyllum commune H4-8]